MGCGAQNSIWQAGELSGGYIAYNDSGAYQFYLFDPGPYELAAKRGR